MQYIIQNLTTRTFAVIQIHSHIYVDHKILHLEVHKMDLFHFQYMDMFFQYQIQDVLLTYSMGFFRTEIFNARNNIPY